MLHSAINPFLYSIYSKRFRNGIQEYIRTRYRSKDQYVTEDSLDRFIRSLNEGGRRGKESKRVVNRSVLKRHFDYRSSDFKRNDLLRKDKDLKIVSKNFFAKNSYLFDETYV